MDHDNFHGIRIKLINVRPLNTTLWSNGQSVDLINSLANAYPLYRGMSPNHSPVKCKKIENKPNANPLYHFTGVCLQTTLRQ